MPVQLRISVHFLDGVFHGHRDGGTPEWPPSPLRLFQAITAAAATQWADVSQAAKDIAALQWLEQLPPPEIVAAHPLPLRPTGHTLYVPDNVGDIAARKWSKGEVYNIAECNTQKHIQPTLLNANPTNKNDLHSFITGDFPAVHYCWILDQASINHINHIRESLFTAVNSISHLGWGIDLVVANATLEEITAIPPLPGERWLPVETPGGVPLRTPVAGTLDALQKRHKAFLHRIKHQEDGSQVFIPVPPLLTFRIITYRRESEVSHPPYAIFALRRPDDSSFFAVDAKWRRLHLSGMLRHTASQPDFAASLGWDENKVNSFVLGHDKTNPNASRLVFIPLPSIEWRGDKRKYMVGSIRRVLLTVHGHCETPEFKRIIRSLEGRELIDEKTGIPVAFLRHQPQADGNPIKNHVQKSNSQKDRKKGDNAMAGYLEKSAVWTTVTPVVLPGYDDPRKLRQRLNSKIPLTAEEKSEILRKLDKRIDSLLRRAIRQAGYPETLVTHAKIEWSSSGFLPGIGMAAEYSAGDQHRRYRRLHVKIHWHSENNDPLEIHGPIYLGSGKFSGMGIFVAPPNAE